MKKEKKHAVKFAKFVVREIFGGAVIINKYRIDIWYNVFCEGLKMENDWCKDGNKEA